MSIKQDSPHSWDAEDLSLLRWYIASLVNQLLMFQTSVMPSSSGRRSPDTVDCLIPNMTALQPTATAKQPGKLEADYKTGTHSSFHLWLGKQNDFLHRMFQKW